MIQHHPPQNQYSRDVLAFHPAGTVIIFAFHTKLISSYFLMWLTESHFFFPQNYILSPCCSNLKNVSSCWSFITRRKMSPITNNLHNQTWIKRVRPVTDPIKSSRLLALGRGCHQTEFGFPLISKKNEGKAKQATRRKLTPSHLRC